MVKRIKRLGVMKSKVVKSYKEGYGEGYNDGHFDGYSQAMNSFEEIIQELEGLRTNIDRVIEDIRQSM